jgi:hypothetical protein
VVTVEIERPTGPPDEPTPLNHNAAPFLCRAPTRGEGDLAVLVALAASDHIRNLQPAPAESGINDNAVWARAGVPCAKEVVGIPHSEGGVPRSHQRLRGRRVGGTAVKSAAASAVLLPVPQGQSLGSTSRTLPRQAPATPPPEARHIAASSAGPGAGPAGHGIQVCADGRLWEGQRVTPKQPDVSAWVPDLLPAEDQIRAQQVALRTLLGDQVVDAW